jgi:pyroglutamyl-peptidase
MTNQTAETLLLTGFGLWGDETSNSSWEAIRDLDPELPERWKVQREKLPVEWEKGPSILSDMIDDTIGAVICFGMCGGDQIRPERLAINLNDRTRADARGRLVDSDFVVKEGPPAYWTAFDYPTLLSELGTAGLPTMKSHDAGGFLCNAVFYTLMHERDLRKASFPAGFIHVPRTLDQGGLPLEQLRMTARVCIDHAVALANRMESRHKVSSASRNSDT